MIRGRKRKPGARHACGKRIRGETEREVMQTALEARQRHYRIGASRARDERLGTSLGRLAFQELISAQQYDAGLRFAELYQRHHMTLGLPMPHPQSPAGLMIAGGSFGGSISEIEPAVIERLRNRFEAATKAIDDCDRASRMGPGRRPSLLLYRVVCVDEDTTLWSMSDIGNLRAALNALTCVFGC